MAPLHSRISANTAMASLANSFDSPSGGGGGGGAALDTSGRIVNTIRSGWTDDSIRDLSQSLNIYIGVAIDLYDGRLNCFSVHNQYFIRSALRPEDARERQDNA